MAQPFDVDRPALRGEPVRVADNAETNALGMGNFTVSTTGVLTYAIGTGAGAGAGSTPLSRLTWYDRDGRVLGSVGEPDTYGDVALSPDGRRVAVHRHEEPTGGGIWLAAVGPQRTRAVLPDGADALMAVGIETDGAALAPGTPRELFKVRMNVETPGAGPLRRVGGWPTPGQRARRRCRR